MLDGLRVRDELVSPRRATHDRPPGHFHRRHVLRQHCRGAKQLEHPANACTPSDTTIRFDRHLLGAASVQHATNNVNAITLLCPMSRFNSGTTTWNLKMTYVDSTGKASSAYARAYVYRMAIGSAAPVILGMANSDASALTGLNTISSAPIAHTFDFEKYIYWVRVDLVRALTSQTVIVYSIFLDGTAI